MKNSYAITAGLVLAGISIVLTLLGAMLSGALLLTIIWLLAIAMTIVIPVIYVKKQREANGNVLSFADGFKTAFLGMIIAAIISFAFMYVYANILDPSYVDLTVERALSMSMKFMEGNMPEDQMIEAMEEIEKETRAGFTLPGLAKSLLTYSIFYIIASLIIAAVMKRSAPLE